MRVVLLHDWLLNIGGAEKVLKTLHEMFPEAPIYTFFYNKNFTDRFVPRAQIISSFLQKFYRFVKKHSLFLPLLPVAAESFDFRNFDVVISSSFGFSKGIVLKPRTTQICYCHSPTRFLWDWQCEYKSNSKYQKSKVLTILLQHIMRVFDRHGSTRVNHFIANSKNTRKRIEKYYRRHSRVIYPPVTQLPATSYQLPANESFYLIVSRLFSHKNIDIAIEAFNRLGLSLIIIGEGPEFKKLKKIKKSNIKMLGFQPDEVVARYYSGCKAFIMPQEEDFGIAPLEAMLYGKPVLALKCGGALEYILEGINGEFFDDPAPEVLADGVRRLNENYKNYSPLLIKKTAERFSKERFEKQILEFIKEKALKPETSF